MAKSVVTNLHEAKEKDNYKSLVAYTAKNVNRMKTIIISYIEKDSENYHWALHGSRAEIRSMLIEMLVGEIVDGLSEDEPDAE